MTQIPGYETLNPAQYQIATEFGDPVFVAAGAGSGKTFAITKRVLRAMQPGSAVGPQATDGPAVLDSLDQALVITFTEKAAAEIKERVRAELLRNGFAEEALQVDTAWVSTIHGMCSRILHDNALELGIDPEFKVLGANISDDLRARAMDHAMAKLHQQNACPTLFASYALQKSDNEGRERVGTITKMLGELMDAAASSCKGMDAVQLVDVQGFSFRSALDAAKQKLGDLLPLQKAKYDETGKPKSAPEAIAAVEQQVADLCELDGCDEDQLIEQLSDPELLKLNGHYFQKNWWGEECYTCGFEAKELMATTNAEAALQKARIAASELLAIAREAWDEYGRLKAERGGLDNDDLLNMTLAAFEANPVLAESCAQQFKLVMVDEFQDTNEQQVRIIDKLIADNPAKLITVGDAQQSIYRFRGADVDVFTRQQDSPDALQVRMTENYRSHDDVLRLVRHVCDGREGAPQLLDGFMDLLAEQNDENPEVAAKAKARHEAAYTPGQPRVFVEGAAGKAALAREVVADRIACRFAQLNQEGKGVPLGSMALLAGSTSSLDIYLDALKRHNLDYVVSGGSNYNKLDEVKVMAALLCTFANPYDTEAGLFPVLQSGMFQLSLDDLCALGTQQGDEAGELWKGSLARAFAEERAAVPEPVGESARMQVALRVLRRAFAALGSKPVADVCRQVVIESGWLARLEDAGMEGKAQAANVLASLDYIRTLTSDMGLGVSRAAYEFNRWLDAAKTGPASLAGEAPDAISVMTIHASKGLQFPVVGVVECFKDPYSTSVINMSPLAMARCGDTFLASLRPTNLKAGRSDWQDVFDEFAQVDAENPGFDMAGASSDELMQHYGVSGNMGLHLLLKHRETQAELAEAARLIYVALTRAEEALVVGLVGNGKSSKAFASDEPGDWARGDTYEKTCYALFGAQAKEWLTAPAQVDFDFGGEEKGLLCNLVVDGEGVQEGEENTDEGTAFKLYDFASEALPVALAGRANPDVYSFSSASRMLEEEASQAGGQEVEAARGNEARADETIPGDADATTLSGDAPTADDEPDTSAVPTGDRDRATNFGSALHMCAQYLVEAGALASGQIDEARVNAIADACGLPAAADARGDGKDRTDLMDALQRWLASDERQEALGYPRLEAEAPFFIQAPTRFGDYLEGAIDLLASNPDAGEALVVDYKTGYLNCTEEEYQAHHRMQAEFYAYVLLDQGLKQVTCKFVAVQRDGAQAGKPLVATYGPFTKESNLSLDW